MGKTMRNTKSSKEYKCFVGGLSREWMDNQLSQAFEPFGPTQAKVSVDSGTGQSKGFGFLIFPDERSMQQAISAMSGIELEGKKLVVYESGSMEGSSAKGKSASKPGPITSFFSSKRLAATRGNKSNKDLEPQSFTAAKDILLDRVSVSGPAKLCGQRSQG